MSKDCLTCGGTGILISGELCDCGCTDEVILPTNMIIPVQYQGVRFCKSFLPKWLQGDYGDYMEQLVIDCTKSIMHFNKNLLICAPPNSGKTIFAYTVYGILFAKGMAIPELLDLIESREIIMAYYNIDYNKVELLSTAKLAVVKIPQDLPSKFSETISTIIERRVRNSSSTIFLYSGDMSDLLAQDRFGKLKALLGDGSYNSLEVKSWKKSD